MTLRADTLATWRGSPVATPDYDRSGLREGIVHIGVGGFHRAHQAVIIDRLLRQGLARDWAICGVGLLPGDTAMRDALVPQDGLYTVAERSAAGEQLTIVGSLTSYLLAADDVAAVVARLAAPATHIVSLTITESGYLRDERTGSLDVDHPDVAADLRAVGPPRSTYGLLTAALAERRRAGLPPFSVVSCDNVQQNGHLVRDMLLAFARRRDPGLADWIGARGAFPSSMVDRITPRTTDADRARLAASAGIVDAWPVITEPYLQWVIEDRFADGRPPWEVAGVQVVEDVEPYERMKLRLLNAGHSAMGYLGALAGFETIHEVIADPDFARYIRALMAEEVVPLLPPVPGIDLGRYCETLIERFGNPTIADQVARICMDGSGKLPVFILPSIREQLARGGSLRRLSLCVAAWCRYLAGEDEQGRAYQVDDPLAAELQARAHAGGADPSPLLRFARVFGDDLASAPSFVREVETALASLYQRGARATLAATAG
ncbi:MAG TPA: mannitol dehydrogenase family protein [Kofleriaceae bacterium]|nr:mannitol dehydrogenase family protein [Kofleriaceae bacterium]